MNKPAHYAKCLSRFPLYLLGSIRHLANWREFTLAIISIGVGARPTMLTLRFRNGISLSFPAHRSVGAVYEFKEIWLLGVYTHRFGLDPSAFDTVLDVGASFGSYTFLAAMKAPRARVYAFEPNPEDADSFHQNLKQNGHIQNIVFHNVFLCGTSNADGPTRYPFSSPRMTFAEFLQGNELHGNVLVKIDIEGGEYDLLMNSSLLAAAHTRW